MMGEYAHAAISKRLKYRLRQTFRPKLSLHVRVRQDIDSAGDPQRREAFPTNAYSLALINQRHAGMLDGVSNGCRFTVIQRRERRTDNQILKVPHTGVA